MDLKVNGVGFQGKKEVIYALTKAAQKAKDFEYYNQPAIAARMTTDKFQTSLDASMQAYLDMALRDETFITTVKEMKPSELYYLHNLLQPERTQHSIVKPMDTFRRVANGVASNIGRGKILIQEALDDLFSKLEL